MQGGSINILRFDFLFFGWFGAFRNGKFQLIKRGWQAKLLLSKMMNGFFIRDNLSPIEKEFVKFDG